MPYLPLSPSGLNSLDSVRQWVEDELNSIAQADNDRQQIRLVPIHSAPLRPRDGMLVYADGTDFNPGGGEGTYEYTNGVWHKLYIPVVPLDFVEATTAVGVSMASGVAKAIGSIALPAGEWTVSALGYYLPASGTTRFKMNVSLSTTTDVQNGTLGYINEQGIRFGGDLTGDAAYFTLPIPAARFVLGASGTVYLNGFITFSGSTVVGGSYICARRFG